MLGDDLVIVARQRAREPELPEATVNHALAAIMPSMAARYDLIVLPPSPEHAAEAASLAVEFARHAHRVFWLHQSGTPWTCPKSPDFEPVELPDGGPETIAAVIEALHLHRDVETAAILVSDESLLSATADARARHGWRRASFGSSGAEVVIGSEPGEVDLASLESWPARWSALDRAFRAAWPRATVIVITFDNLAYNRMCLASLLENTDYPNL
ncbi:MAG: hypothetical protein ACR2J8_07145, partial [Thermomicrobiales bacterium]